MTTFATQLQAIAIDATSFAGERLSAIKAKLDEADALVAELRAAGIGVTIRHPISVRDGVALTRFELSLAVEIQP